MEIRFTKGRDKPGIFTCTRKDGSLAWSSVNYYQIEHNFTHYAVETILAIKDGYYGLISAGLGVEDYDHHIKEGSKASLSVKNIERLCYLLDKEIKEDRTNAYFNQALADICRSHGDEPPEPIESIKLAAIRKTIKRLRETWGQLEPNHSIVLYYTE